MYVFFFIDNNFSSGSELSDLQCMLQRDEAHLWMAGHQNLMLEVDLKKGLIINKVIINE